MTRTPRTILLAILLAAGACEAGPSAFARGAAAGNAIDTADVAELAETPRAEDVEVERLPADDDVSVVPGAARGGAALAAPAGRGTAPGGAPPATEAEEPVREPLPAGEAPRFERPEHVRGIYLNAWAAGSRRRIEALIDLARRTEINTFVIDIKDASGFVSHRTSVPLAREIGATGELRIGDLPGLLRRLHAEGIYPIARIVIVKDPLLAAARPEMTVQSRNGGVFQDGKGIVWMNPYDRQVWDYHLQLAREVAGMGFPEIQWDYVRFPDIPASEATLVSYPGAGELSKAGAIRAFLAYSREELADLGVQVTADVFGVTTSAARDVGIGQVWESFIDAVDVALPMVYPSHYWKGSFGYQTPNAYPYEIVYRALEDAMRRSRAVEGAGATRPWLQDFSLGEPAYGAPEVRAQIQATYDVGIDEWILWNPGGRYTEAALEPEGGFGTDPLIRIADRIVPASGRTAVLDSVRAARAAADSARAAARAAADSARARAARAAADTTAPPDTAGAARRDGR